MIQPVTEISEGNRIELSLNGGILMKGQPTEVLAGSGESAEDAENPESGKPPILSLKIQGEGRVVQGESWSPGRQEGCWARNYTLGSGKQHLRFYRVIASHHLDWGTESAGRNSFSLPCLWSPTCAFLLLAKPEASWKESAFRGKNSKEEGEWLHGGAGGRGWGGKTTGKLNYVTVPGVWFRVAGWSVSLWSHFSEVYQEIPFWENNV